MVRYSITDRAGRLRVQIEGYEGPRLPLLEAFRECRDGRCTCPSDQYQQVETFEVDEVDGRIELDLVPRKGAQIDPAAVRRCLESTFARFADVERT